MNTFVIFVKWLLMGACDVVPGVSWGTMAFITGIYERLIDAIHAIDVKAIKLFFTGKRKQFFKKIDAWFLFPLVLGIFTAIISLAQLIHYLLETHPVAIWATFGGLLIASIVIIARHLPQWTKALVLRAFVGTIIGYVLTSLPITQIEPNNVTTFVAGAIAIMAMVLPGISGSYILLMLNHYQHIINTLVSTIDGVKEGIALMVNGLWEWALYHMSLLPWDTLIVFMFGALVWVIAFVKILHWIKAHYHDQLIAVLIGLMIGALHKVWPWKEVVQTFTDRHGDVKPLIEQNILPISGSSALFGLLFVVLGAGVILIIEYIATYKGKKQ